MVVDLWQQLSRQRCVCIFGAGQHGSCHPLISACTPARIGLAANTMEEALKDDRTSAEDVASVGTNTKPHQHVQSPPISQENPGPKVTIAVFETCKSSPFRSGLPIRCWGLCSVASRHGIEVDAVDAAWMGLMWWRGVTNAILFSLADSVRKGTCSPRTPDGLTLFELNLARRHVDLKTEPSHHLRKSLQGFVVSLGRFLFIWDIL